MHAKHSMLILASAVASLLPFESAAHAQANLEACNDIYVEAGAECTVIPPSASCEAQCTPIKVEAACAAQLQVECDASCNANVDVGCAVDCSGTCEAKCEVKPGEFDCQGYCQADCSGSCDAECGAGADGARCRASCQATCSADCNAECKITPPTATCKAKCDASCKGSCHAEANIDCQAKCQADGFIKCEADIMGGCKVDCQSQEGALFCDGYYVDTNDNLQMCVDALKAALDVEYSASSSGSCVDGVCEGKADASASCSAAPGSNGSSASFLLILTGMLVYRVRRRR